MLKVLFEMPNLEELKMSGCHLTNIEPFDFAKCHIKRLSLNQNPLNEESLQNILNISSLERLEISDCNLKKVPKFQPSTKLFQLIMPNNDFSGDNNVNALFQLKSLKTLNIGNCQITSLSHAKIRGYSDPLSNYNFFLSLKIQVLYIGSNVLDEISLSLIV